MVTTPRLKRGQRLPDAEKRRVGAQLLREYESGKSIRELCGQTGYSIGRTRRLLGEAGVTFRARGGATRSKAKQTYSR